MCHGLHKILKDKFGILQLKKPIFVKKKIKLSFKQFLTSVIWNDSEGSCDTEDWSNDAKNKLTSQV